jgi:hypothetical protein
MLPMIAKDSSVAKPQKSGKMGENWLKPELATLLLT